MERVEFNPLMDKFSRFYKTKLDELQTDWWFDTFKDIPARDFLCALNWHISHDQYNCLPAPGKINAALEAVEEERLNNPPTYPQFTTLWCRVIEHFPGNQDYPHYPPENDTKAWEALYDKVVRIPGSTRQQAVEKVMCYLAQKYNASEK
jgi:hypothetical protein